MLTVSVAAGNTAVTTLETVKAQLSIATTDEDTYLTGGIATITAAICAYLNVAPGQDGARTLGRETLVETFRQKRLEPFYPTSKAPEQMILSRVPVVSIASIVEDGTTLTVDDWELDQGMIYRLYSDRRGFWYGCKIVVTYTAGWLMPEDEGRTLPQEIEDAAVEWIKTIRFNRTRDPQLRGENILESLYSYTLFAPSDLKDGIPQTVAAALAPYRNIRF